MPSIDTVQARSEALFTRLLQAQSSTGRPRRRRGGVAARAAVAGPAGSFSWFDTADALTSTLVAFRYAARAASMRGRAAALDAVLDDVEDSIGRARPEMIRQALAMFVTHNANGRYLVKPRTVLAAPQLFTPVPTLRRSSRPVSPGGAAPGLDYWREDPMANEHHGHWHEVYPYLGRIPEDFGAWIQATPEPTLVRILETIAPNPDWAATLGGMSSTQAADLFAQVFSDANVDAIRNAFLGGQFPVDLFRVMFTLNDRHGELFVYMHQQMLARYDAELLSNGLRPVTAFGPRQWIKPIPEGQIPTGFPAGWDGVFAPRDEGQSLPDGSVATLRRLQRDVTRALRDGEVSLDGGPGTPLSRDVLGEFLESGIHNTGHGLIAALRGASAPAGDANGVMGSTISAIRDQVFWRWHQHIDDLAAAWQDRLDPEPFDDAPDVVVRNTLDGAATPWASPDVILVRTRDLPVRRSARQLAQLGRSLFGGQRWDSDFRAATATAGSTRLTTVDEIVTSMQSSTMADGRSVRTLTHEPFTYFLRIENRAASALDVTVRLFLVPAATAADRRAWIEMDKFSASLPARAKTVLVRSDRDASVIKRPAEDSPAAIQRSNASGRERAYCDCGWPYPLLVPRGTNGSGMEYRLLMIVTDAAIDRVPTPGHCGSMSFCGAVDRYPDTREMGYPFHRRFAGSRSRAIRDAVVAWPNGAARTITIRHA